MFYIVHNASNALQAHLSLKWHYYLQAFTTREPLVVNKACTLTSAGKRDEPCTIMYTRDSMRARARVAPLPVMFYGWDIVCTSVLGIRDAYTIFAQVHQRAFMTSSHPQGGPPSTLARLTRLETMYALVYSRPRLCICTLCPPKSPYRAIPVHPASAQHLQEGSGW